MRTSIKTHFLNLARQIATRATCDRKHVGAVIARDGRILSTGYNGSVSGEPHCDVEGHLLLDGHCVRTVHAEINAVAQAAREGVRLEGAVCYVTLQPCWNCLKALAQAGISHIVFADKYENACNTYPQNVKDQHRTEEQRTWLIFWNPQIYMEHHRETG